MYQKQRFAYQNSQNGDQKPHFPSRFSRFGERFSIKGDSLPRGGTRAGCDHVLNCKPPNIFKHRGTEFFKRKDAETQSFFKHRGTETQRNFKKTPKVLVRPAGGRINVPQGMSDKCSAGRLDDAQ